MYQFLHDLHRSLAGDAILGEAPLQIEPLEQNAQLGSQKIMVLLPFRKPLEQRMVSTHQEGFPLKRREMHDQLLIDVLPTEGKRLDLLDMFAQMQDNGRGIIPEMDMEMVLEESRFVAEVIQENARKRHACQKRVSSDTDAAGDAVQERLAPVEKKTSHGDM